MDFFLFPDVIIRDFTQLCFIKLCHGHVSTSWTSSHHFAIYTILKKRIQNAFISLGVLSDQPAKVFRSMSLTQVRWPWHEWSFQNSAELLSTEHTCIDQCKTEWWKCTNVWADKCTCTCTLDICDVHPHRYEWPFDAESTLHKLAL